MGKKTYCGVDVGGTKILAGLVDSTGTVIARKKCATPQKASATRVYNQIRTLITDLLKEQRLDADCLHGIGMGVPGIVLPNRIDILRAPNIALANFPLAQKLSRHFGLKVVLGNDVNLGLLGETWLGIGRGYENIVGLFPGTGVGGAIVINGKLVDGAQGAAGELGHIIIEQRSKKTSAGLYGTLEALASRRAIERDIRDEIKAGQKSVVTKLLDKPSDVIKSKILSKSLDKKDPVVVKVINNVCVTLANACISMRHTFNPEMIVFGGGLMEACGSYMLPRIRRRCNASPFLKGIDKCKIVVSELGDDAVVVGAVALLKQELKQKKSVKSRRYPVIQIQRNNRLMIADQHIKADFYVRSDGKIKELGSGEAFKSYYQKRIIGYKILKKVCKQNTEVVVIARRSKMVRLSQEAKDFLAEHSIKCTILPIKDAVNAYSTLNRNKALFVSQEST